MEDPKTINFRFNFQSHFVSVPPSEKQKETFPFSESERYPFSFSLCHIPCFAFYAIYYCYIGCICAYNTLFHQIHLQKEQKYFYGKRYLKLFSVIPTVYLYLEPLLVCFWFLLIYLNSMQFFPSQYNAADTFIKVYENDRWKTSITNHVKMKIFAVIAEV